MYPVFLLRQPRSAVRGDRRREKDTSVLIHATTCESASLPYLLYFVSFAEASLTRFLCGLCFLVQQLNGWRLFDVTSHCLASRLSRGATINTISSDFFNQSLLLPLTRAANILNIHRNQTNTALTVNQVRRTLFCRVINHLHENTWNEKACSPPHEKLSTSSKCAKCSTASRPR